MTIQIGLTSLVMCIVMAWWCRSKVHKNRTGLPVRILAANNLLTPTGIASLLPWMESPCTGSITSTWRCHLIKLTWIVILRQNMCTALALFTLSGFDNQELMPETEL